MSSDGTVKSNVLSAFRLRGLDLKLWVKMNRYLRYFLFDFVQWCISILSGISFNCSISFINFMAWSTDWFIDKTKSYVSCFSMTIYDLILFLYHNLVSSSTVDKTLVTNVVQELRAQLSNDSQFVSLFKDYFFQFCCLFIPVAKLFFRFWMLFPSRSSSIQDQWRNLLSISSYS